MKLKDEAKLNEKFLNDHEGEGAVFNDREILQIHLRSFPRSIGILFQLQPQALDEELIMDALSSDRTYYEDDFECISFVDIIPPALVSNDVFLKLIEINGTFQRNIYQAFPQFVVQNAEELIKRYGEEREICAGMVIDDLLRSPQLFDEICYVDPWLGVQLKQRSSIPINRNDWLKYCAKDGQVYTLVTDPIIYQDEEIIEVSCYSYGPAIVHVNSHGIVLTERIFESALTSSVSPIGWMKEENIVIPPELIVTSLKNAPKGICALNNNLITKEMLQTVIDVDPQWLQGLSILSDRPDLFDNDMIQDIIISCPRSLQIVKMIYAGMDKDLDLDIQIDICRYHPELYRICPERENPEIWKTVLAIDPVKFLPEILEKVGSNEEMRNELILFSLAHDGNAIRFVHPQTKKYQELATRTTGESKYWCVDLVDND